MHKILLICLSKRVLMLLSITVISLLGTGCSPAPVYIEPVGENTATVVIHNNTINTEGKKTGNEMYQFYVFENSKNCTQASQFNPGLISYGRDSAKRKRVSFKVPLRKDFTFEVSTYIKNTARRCYMYGTFTTEKSKTYVMTLTNELGCSLSVVERGEGNKQTRRVKSFIPRRGKHYGTSGDERCFEGRK